MNLRIIGFLLYAKIHQGKGRSVFKKDFIEDIKTSLGIIKNTSHLIGFKNYWVLIFKRD
jgi:hypothetical protein